MDSITRLLTLAARKAWNSNKRDKRCFLLGAVALRNDGVLVHSRNGSAYDRMPVMHAEARLSRKLDKGAIVFVARVTRDKQWALSRPCCDCLRTLKRKGVIKIYYTIAPNEYGCINVE